MSLTAKPILDCVAALPTPRTSITSNKSNFEMSDPKKPRFSQIDGAALQQNKAQIEIETELLEALAA